MCPPAQGGNAAPRSGAASRCKPLEGSFLMHSCLLRCGLLSHMALSFQECDKTAADNNAPEDKPAPVDGLGLSLLMLERCQQEVSSGRPKEEL
eukprot:scaffold184081_cov53-Prasinocladus_malaysianus.AAC.1